MYWQWLRVTRDIGGRLEEMPLQLGKTGCQGMSEL